MIDEQAAGSNTAPASEKRLLSNSAAFFSSSPLSTAVESNADNASRRWSIDNRSETPSKMSVTNHLFRYFSRRSTRDSTGAVPVPGSDDSTINVLREELRGVRGELEGLVGQLEEARQSIRMRDTQLSGYAETKEYCEKLLKRNSELELSICGIQDEFEGRLRNYDKLLSSTSTSATAAAAASEEVAALKTQMAGFKAEHEKAHSQIAQLNRDIQALEKSLETAVSDKAGLEKGLGLVREEYENFRNLYQRQLSEISSTTDSVKSIMKENMNLNVDMKNLQTLKVELEQKNAELRNSLTKAREDTRRALEDGQLKQNQLAAIHKSYERLKQSLLTITGIEIPENGQDEDRARSVLELRLRVDTLNAELDRYKIKMSDLEVMNMKLKEQIKNHESVNTIATDLLKRNSDLESRLHKFENAVQQNGKLTVDLNKAHKEIKSLEAHILVLNRKLDAAMSSASANAAPASSVLSILDKQFIESLKQEHDTELNRLHQHYKSEIERCTQAARVGARTELEKSMREKFISEFNERLETYEKKMETHYNEQMRNLERQSANRFNELKKELAQSQQEYERAVRNLKCEYDQKMKNAAEEMDQILNGRNSEILSLKNSVHQKTTALQFLNQQLQELNQKFASLQQDHLEELESLRKRAAQAQFSTAGTGSPLAGGGLDKLVARLKDEFDSERSQLVKQIQESENYSRAQHQEVSDLNRRCLELESSIALRDNELAVLKNDLQNLSNANSGGATDASSLASLISRNKELEETIAVLSNKLHDALNQAAAARAAGTRRATLQVVEVESASSLHAIQSLQHKITELELVRSELTANLSRSSLPAQSPSNAQIPSCDEKLKELYSEIFAKIQNLSDNVREGFEMDKATREAHAELIEKQIDRIKLSKTIELLKSARDQRVMDIENLEAELRKARASNTGGSGGEYERLYRKTVIERDRVEDLTKKLRQAIDDKNLALNEELKLRSAQLKVLEDTKSTLSTLLGKNTELENQLRALLNSSNRTEANAGTFERIEQMLGNLESNAAAIQEAHSLELMRLQRSITERDDEMGKLHREHEKLEQDLKDSERLKIQLLEQEYKNRLQIERDEAKHLRDMIKSLEKNLADSQNSLDDSNVKFQELVKSISSQLSQNDLIVAEIQEQKNSEIAQIQNSLNISLASQQHLNQEIENIQQQLRQKSQQFQKTDQSLKMLLKEIGGADGGAEGGTAAVEHLRMRFKELSKDVTKNRNEYDRLKQYFDALVKRQEQEVALARDQKAHLRDLVVGTAPDEDMGLQKDLKVIDASLKSQAALVKRHAQSVGNFDGEFTGLEEVEAGLARLDELNAKSQRETAAALAATERSPSSFATRALTTIVHRVQTIVQNTLESRTTTCDGEETSSGSKRRRGDCTPPSQISEASKRPRL